MTTADGDLTRELIEDATFAGELAAARVAHLPPLRLSERCSECQAKSIEWLRWAGREYGGCPHSTYLEAAS